MDRIDVTGGQWGEHLSYRQAEIYTGLSRTTLWRLLKCGELSAVKIGTAVRFSRVCLDEYMQSNDYSSR